MRYRLPLVVLLLGAVGPAHAQNPTFLKDGDRVVMIGDTLIERDQLYGYLETAIIAANPDKSITFRNLGWSGDTVRGLSRARFGPPAEGYQHLVDHVKALKPTVLIVGYGMAESFEGEAGLPSFVAGLKGLLDEFKGLNARVVLVSPIRHEDLGPPLPNPARHNAVLKQYADAIGAVARTRQAVFVDLFGVETGVSRDPRLTDDGIHLVAFGYHAVVTPFRQALRVPDRRWDVALDAAPTADKAPEAFGTVLSAVRRTANGVGFTCLDAMLPPPLVSPKGTAAITPRDRRLKVVGLAPGTYSLAIDGQAVASATAEDWGRGVMLGATPERAQEEQLRAAVIAKNELYFHRWRPQNETYLFGFRKHEQGNNAREIPLFDPLVEAKEKEIARLKTPVAHAYELTRK